MLAGSIEIASDVTDYAIRRQVVPHIVTLFQRASIDNFSPLSNAYQMDRVSNVLYDNGQYSQALPLRHQALELKRKLLGSEHKETIASMNNLAVTVR